MKKIKIWEFTRPTWGVVFKKISTYLRKYSPDWIQWTNNMNESDLQIVHVVGTGECSIMDTCKNLIVFQQCYSTAQADIVSYDTYWERSILSISFHPLNEYTHKKFNFLRTPLGADPTIFRQRPVQKLFDVCVTGYVPETECIDKLYTAVSTSGKKMIHTGQDFSKIFGWSPQHYLYRTFMPEEKLAETLCQSRYVSCMRLEEGFEVMGVEGLMCGTRPIVPNLRTYDFYKEHAEFVDVSNPNLIVDQLIKILNTEPKPIDQNEMQTIVHTFSWKNIVDNIFSTLQKLV